MKLFKQKNKKKGKNNKDRDKISSKKKKIVKNLPLQEANKSFRKENIFEDINKRFDLKKPHLLDNQIWTIQINGHILRKGSKSPILFINSIFTPWVTVIYWNNGSGKTTLIKNMAWVVDGETLNIKAYKTLQMSTDKIYADLQLSMGQEKITKHKYMIDNSEHILIDEPFENIDETNKIKFIKYLIDLNKELIDNKSRCVILVTNNAQILELLSKIFITYIIKDKKLVFQHT